MPAPAPSFDVAIVLGATVTPDGTPSPALARRVACAVDLAASGQVASLLMSGGPVRHCRPEAQVMRDLALAAGIAPERIFVEEASRNTIGNALLCRPIVAAHRWQRILVVTDSVHLFRALYIFRRFGLCVSGVAARRPEWPGYEGWLGWGREILARPWTVIRVEWLRLWAGRRYAPGLTGPGGSGMIPPDLS
ncbi:YdcF family protein [Magnetospirillum molischianum]|uniref:DUF218 domain-containing protein n=1 Tax=Magnetospirillum molischianum DSM 120 TaxID=1150626 RepID=H8FWX8_MAGML|nr:YdcF family protein [Magnetospirillum molischianum]CCG42866.1 conserved hypothetical protein [Magnetospirillum molischianum DSM 120]